MQKKIMKLKDYDDGSSSWRIACDCQDPNHDCQLWFEPTFEGEPQIKDISLVLSLEVGIYKNYNLWENLWKRITIAAKVLFTGYYTATGEVILDEDGIKAMQLALEQGLAHAKTH
jgi:hypothetical protein